MFVTPQNHWAPFFAQEMEKPYFQALSAFVETQYRENTVFPPMEKIFSAFAATDLPDVRVVILGQDPYHEPGQAMGLSFSVEKGVELPRSLRNIYRELESDCGIPPAPDGDLTRWTRQGVFLLNTVLTVRQGQAGSHAGKGWEAFTDSAIRYLDADDSPKVFLLWGNHARSKKELLENPRHLVLEAAHPSPLSARRGFFGCRHFSKANEFLIQQGFAPVRW